MVAETESILQHAFPDLISLKRAYMPFVVQGGIFIPTSNDYKLGEFIKVSLTLPESNHTYTFSGEVIWITPNSNHAIGVGVTCHSEEGQAFRKATMDAISELKSEEREVSDTM